MGNYCNNKVKQTCGEPTYSTCVEYEGTVNNQSELIGESCLDQEIVDQDQYNQLEKIWDEINLSELGNNCLEYVETDEGKIVVKNVLLKYEEEICSLKEELETLKNRQICDIPISECITDLSCLSLPCDDSIVTLGDWMIAVQNKICE